MPAAELSKLKAQINAISTQFEEPPIFLHSVLALMELYSDQHYKPGDLSGVRHLIPEYRLPALVIQQLSISLSELTVVKPVPATQIMDALWKNKYFEPRLIAAIMLRSLPTHPIEPLIERIRNWMDPEIDNDLITALLNSCHRLFTVENMGVWLDLIQFWLGLDNVGSVKIGLRALQVILNDPKFANIEKIFPLIEPAMLNPNSALQRDQYSLIESLNNYSEMETTAFLRSILTRTSDPEVIRFIRRCLPLLAPESQVIIRSLMNPSKRS
jgi:hypothetical protein